MRYSSFDTIAATLTAVLVALGVSAAWAQGGKPKMATDIPPEITTPDSVETRIGTLKFFDGFPSDETVAKVHDNLVFMRGVEVFLNCIRGTSTVGIHHGARDVGIVDGTIGTTETLMDSKSLFLTPNTDTVYAITWLDLSKGPVVVESPPNTLGIVDSGWWDYVTDMGNAGPDKGKGGKYLFLPPDFKGTPPPGYFTFKSPTFGNPMFWRGFQVNGDPGPAVENIKKHARIYPLSQAANPPKQKFVNVSGLAFNTIHANDYQFYEEINELVQAEPNSAADPETLGLLAAIGIEKGKPFAPDERTKKILVEAAAVAMPRRARSPLVGRAQRVVSIRTASGRWPSSVAATSSKTTVCAS